MPKTNLTDLTVRGLKAPTSGQTTYWDDGLSGFGVRVSPGGTKTFTVMHSKDRRRVTIGRYPILSLADARSIAKKLLAEVTLEKRTGRSPSISLSKALELYLTTHCGKNNRESTRKETERLLHRHFAPMFKEGLLETVSTHDLARIIDGLLSTPGEANHAFAAIRGFLRWATRRRYISHSPCEGMRLPARAKTRERVLTDEELTAVFRTARQVGYPFGTIVQVLILTAQRRGEIARLRWDYINEDECVIALPASVTKNNRAHVFPYGDMCAEVLSAIPKIDEVYLFPARGNPEQTFSGWSKAKRSFDALCPIAPWTLHDLRRTAATNLAAFGTPPHVTERLLNHASGTVSGVAAIYNRHAYMDEMRKALRAWERQLNSIS